jgi:hypothetical protein
LELVISFVVGFILTWFFIKTEEDTLSVNTCPRKEVIVKLAEDNSKNKKMVREIREYSLVQIQQGNYEYAEVLNALKKKDRDDKS